MNGLVMTNVWVPQAPVNWTTEALGELAGLEEGQFLEFKKASEFVKNRQFRMDLLTRQLARTCSAFANAEGGTLILGAQTDFDPADRKRETLRPLDESLESHDLSFTTSQLRDRIVGNLSPRLSEVHVSSVSLTVASGEINCWIIEVNASTVGAHQAIPQKVYYRRRNDANEGLLDFEIRDINARISAPLLIAGFEILTGPDAPVIEGQFPDSSSIPADQVDSPGPPHFPALLRVMLRNVGPAPADAARLDIGLPSEWIENRAAGRASHISRSTSLDSFPGSDVSIVLRQASDSAIHRLNRKEAVVDQTVLWYTASYNSSSQDRHPIWGRDEIPTVVDHWWIRRNSAPSRKRHWIPWRTVSAGRGEVRGVSLLHETPAEFEVSNYGPADVSWVGYAEGEAKFSDLKSQMGLES